MEPRASHTFDAFRLEPPPGGLWRAWGRHSGGAAIEALCHIVRVGTSDVAGPVSALETSGDQGPSGGCRLVEAAKLKCALSRH
jgi:hypothetical protein